MKRYIRCMLILLMVSLPVIVYAQDFEDEEDVEDNVPLDGGLSLLAISGIMYGAKKRTELKHKRRS